MEMSETPLHKLSGSVRVDLVGGTLDLHPINLILPNVYTFNVATSLKSEIEVCENSSSAIIFNSKDYNTVFSFELSDFTQEKLRSDYFKQCTFLSYLLTYFFDNNFLDKSKGLTFYMKSGSPAGAGLGGSSAMGIVFFQTLLKLTNMSYSHDRIVSIVQGYESLILGAGPAGYQDYYPALTGGVLGLKGDPDGIKIEQFFTTELKSTLENNLVLVYSGQSRQSGINNWEVYKGFFDKNPDIVNGLNEINKISYEFREKIRSYDFEALPQLIAKEGEVREQLFPTILTNEMKQLFQDLKELNLAIGIKVCGAGGGGCFLLVTDNKKDLLNYSFPNGMKVLEFLIEAPLL